MAKKEKVSNFTTGKAAAEEEQQPQSTALPLQHPTPRCLKMLLCPGMHPGLWTPFSIKCNNTKPECDLFFFLQKADFSRLASHNRAYINIHYCSNSLAMGMATRSRNSPSSDRYCTVSAASDLALPTSLWPWSIQNPNIALFQSFVFFLGPRKAILTREINGVGILSKPDFLQFFRQNRACRYLLSPSLQLKVNTLNSWWQTFYLVVPQTPAVPSTPCLQSALHTAPASSPPCLLAEQRHLLHLHTG